MENEERIGPPTELRTLTSWEARCRQKSFHQHYAGKGRAWLPQMLWIYFSPRLSEPIAAWWYYCLLLPVTLCSPGFPFSPSKSPFPKFCCSPGNNHLLIIPQWLSILVSWKPKVLPMAFRRTLKNEVHPHPTTRVTLFLTSDLLIILLQLHSFLSCSSNAPSTFTPQGLCTCPSLNLEFSILRCLHGFLPHLHQVLKPTASKICKQLPDPREDVAAEVVPDSST